MPSVAKVAIVGGSGYTGEELLRLLARHPHAEIIAVCSRSEEGNRIDKVFPFLRGTYSLEFCSPSTPLLKQADLVFFATPNAVAMQHSAELLEVGVRIIDLSADFRIKDPAVWKRWYLVDHVAPQLLSEAVYGLPELAEEGAIANARLVANPGCYATAMQLALAPLMAAHETVDISNIVVDGKSGLSGAGKVPVLSSLLAQASENFTAYKVTGHRHQAESFAQLARLTKRKFSLTFVPHLVPMVRGILATCYLPCLDRDFDFIEYYENYYKSRPCIDILPEATSLETKSVAGTNICRISPQVQERTLVVISMLDNLVKGAAGQAVQNMNIMLGYEETLGMIQLPHYP